MFRILIKQANTPLQRVGYLLLFVSIGAWVLTALHWNIFHQGFIYQYQHSWIEKIKKPSQAPEGAYWKDGSYGWELYDKKCVKVNRPGPSISIDSLGKITKTPQLFYIPPKKCRKEIKHHNRRYRNEWKKSFGRYFEESFNSKRGGYFYINTPATIFLFLGAILFFGWADKLFSWIRSGEKS